MIGFAIAGGILVAFVISLIVFMNFKYDPHSIKFPLGIPTILLLVLSHFFLGGAIYYYKDAQWEQYLVSKKHGVYTYQIGQDDKKGPENRFVRFELIDMPKE